MRQDKIVELGQGLRTAFIIKSAEYPQFLVGGGMNATITIHRQM